MHAHSTVRNNRRMVPMYIIWAKNEAEDAVHGALRWSVNLLAGIFAFGWMDGCPVQMRSTADSSDQRTTFPRQVGNEKK
jgi:hypothetical protein